MNHAIPSLTSLSMVVAGGLSPKITQDAHRQTFRACF
jgi:hypothetical protein